MLTGYELVWRSTCAGNGSHGSRLRDMIAEEFLRRLSSKTALKNKPLLHAEHPVYRQHGMSSCVPPSNGPTWSSPTPTLSVVRENGFPERLREASRAFAPPGSTVQQVAEALVSASPCITGAEFAALLIDNDTGFQTVAALRGELWKGQVSAENGVMVAASIVVTQMVADCPRETSLSLLHVVPLAWECSVMGYWIIGDRYSTSLSEETVGLVTLLAHHTQLTIANAIFLERLEHMAITDPLTELANRRYFSDALDDHLSNAVRDGSQVSLIFIDIDHFKSVNDRFGHPAGDYVLKQVAAILQRAVRGQHLVARYGGEEFAVLMEKTDRRCGWGMAESIRHAVAAGILNHDTGSLKCTVSLGIAAFPEDATNKTQLIAKADRALYLAKHLGRNRTMSLPRVGWECFQGRG